MKALALYLPQFHRIPENDEWWGEGYTEWTAVKNGEQLFPGHYQPHVPLNHNYYDLLEKGTMQWQAELLKKYNVYGMCFYHYYFQNGRKVLEKPAQNLLQWTDIDMPFCFSWANQTWARTWSKVSGMNFWNSKVEKVQEDSNDGILLRQNYGEEKDWAVHFNYLLPFFQDTRYIRVDNKPIFLIYAPDDIPCLSQMMEKWNVMAKEYGMDGIYFIATNSTRGGMDAHLMQKINYGAVGSDHKKDYDELCEKIISEALKQDNDCYLCGYTGYDDTPRRGEAGLVVDNSSPQKFGELMKLLCYLSEQREKEFVFVNAWNEWGEGMHLEPDKKFGYGYLEALSEALHDYKNYGEKYFESWETVAAKSDQLIIERRNTYIMHLFDKWLRIKESEKTLSSYFEKKSYKEIAIYGIGMVGKHLLTELECTDVNVIYGIDKQGSQLNFSFPIYKIGMELPKADVIVVTVMHEFDKIYKELRRKYRGSIVSIEEVVDFIEGEDD